MSAFCIVGGISLHRTWQGLLPSYNKAEGGAYFQNGDIEIGVLQMWVGHVSGAEHRCDELTMRLVQL